MAVNFNNIVAGSAFDLPEVTFLRDLEKAPLCINFGEISFWFSTANSSFATAGTAGRPRVLFQTPMAFKVAQNPLVARAVIEAIEPKVAALLRQLQIKFTDMQTVDLPTFKALWRDQLSQLLSDRQHAFTVPTRVYTYEDFANREPIKDKQIKRNSRKIRKNDAGA